ncbi:MAG: hypothetical protein VCB25_06915 [Myxococcota bacterium]
MLINRFRPEKMGRRVRASIARALMVCLAMIGGFAMAVSAQADPKLLLLPIVVHSSEDPEYLRNGLADMLAARFSRIGSLEVLQPAGPSSFLSLEKRYSHLCTPAVLHHKQILRMPH